MAWAIEKQYTKDEILELLSLIHISRQSFRVTTFSIKAYGRTFLVKLGIITQTQEDTILLSASFTIMSVSYTQLREPDVRMNPVLLKPSSDTGSQLIVNGEVRGQYRSAEYFKMKKSLVPEILRAYESLAAENDVIVIEGAGSPA